MLVVTRRASESVVISEKEDVVVKVLSINGRQVRLGIEAPNSVPVHREEIFLRINDQCEITGS